MLNVSHHHPLSTVSVDVRIHVLASWQVAMMTPTSTPATGHLTGVRGVLKHGLGSVNSIQCINTGGILC